MTANPSDYIDSQTALIAIVVSLLIMNPPSISKSLIAKVGLGWGLWTAATSFGVEADGAAVVATFMGVRALYRVYQIVLTLLATFPLQLTFPYVVDLIPRFSIAKTNFFNADGASAEVAERREKALEAMQAKWKKKYSKCLEFSTDLKTLISDVRFTRHTPL